MLKQQLHIEKADFFGFSNGGMSCLQIAFRHPQLVNTLVLASTPYKREGMQPGFSQGLQAMFDRERHRMLAFRDFSDSDLRAIAAPVLILAILPGGHGDYLGEICARDKNSKVPALVTTVIEQFLAADTSELQTP